jgi:hypothetical protein
MTASNVKTFGKPLSLATLAVGLVIGFAATIAMASAQRWTLGDADIAKLEAGIKLETLPRWDARLPPLSGYARYYAGSTMNNEKVILGELVTPLGSAYKPGIHIVESKRTFPTIYDGGCAVINLVYSLKLQKIVSIGCNGFA